MAVAVFLAFITGVCLVVNRTLNARLAAVSSATVSCAYNYITGLAASLVVLLVVAALGGLPVISSLPHPLAFTGGLIGVVSVSLLNVIVGRISQVYLSLLTFLGQVFTGLMLDWLLTGAFSPKLLIGGLLVSAGLCFNFMLDRRGTA